MPNKRTKNLRLGVDPILTSLAQQFEQSAFVSQFILPDTFVEKKTGEYPVFGNEHMRVHDTSRPMKAPVKTMPTDNWSLKEFMLNEHALETALDYLEIEAAEDVMDLEKYALDALLASLYLGKEVEAIELIQNTATYSVDHVEALSSGEEFNDPLSDPLVVIQDAMETVRRKINYLPNVLIFGPRVFNALQNHPKILDRIKYTQTGIVSEALIAGLIGNNVTIKIGSGMYEDPATKTNIDLWGDVVAMAYNKNLARTKSKFEQSFGKTFLLNGYPEVSFDSANHSKLQLIAATMFYKAHITQKDAGFLITNAYVE
ncbi:MAG: major capsid protein [Candidatus Kapabacteria bacterium]|nr:major capsid protein [Candidatus Kapabacteria bacterium]